MKRKIERLLVSTLAKIVAIASPRRATGLTVGFYKKYGMRISGTPNYISAATWFDGTDYSLISLGDGCTISSFVRILSHDWAAHTVLGATANPPIGRIAAVEIGAHSFIGTGCVIMPGARIGNHVIVGAGSVVRGEVPDGTIVAGSPAVEVGSVADYVRKRFPEHTELLPKQRPRVTG